jgi:hypothetical protein
MEVLSNEYVVCDCMTARFPIARADVTARATTKKMKRSLINPNVDYNTDASVGGCADVWAERGCVSFSDVGWRAIEFRKLP